MQPKIVPFLWYAKEAEEAARFYASIFPDSDKARSKGVTDAMLKMITLDIDTLQAAYDGRSAT